MGGHRPAASRIISLRSPSGATPRSRPSICSSSEVPLRGMPTTNTNRLPSTEALGSARAASEFQKSIASVILAAWTSASKISSR